MNSSGPGSPSTSSSGPAAATNSSGAAGPAANTQAMDTLLTRHHFQLELERSTQQTNKEEHNKRLKNLRKTVEHLSKTEWKFTSIDKLIGQ